MADRRPIGQILRERRERLGVSIDRAADDTKLRRAVIEAFESTDFEAMPPGGYAQASLASYARYLGFVPSEILPVFQRQLDSYERANGRREVTDTGSFAVGTASARGARSGRPVGSRRDEPASPPRPGAAGRLSDARRQGDGGRDPRRRPYDVRDLYDDGFSYSHRGRGPRDPEGDGSADVRYPPLGGRADDGRPSSLPRTGAREAARPSRDTGPGRRTPQPSSRIGTPPRSDRGASPRRGTGRGAGRGDGPQTVTLREIAEGLYDFFRTNTLVTLIIVGAFAIVLLVVILVAATSCSRTGGGAPNDDPIPVEVVQGSRASTGVRATTVLDASVDLDAVPTGSVVSIAVSNDAPAAPWVEAYVDEVPAGASIAPLGSSQTWTLERSARVMLSSIDGVEVKVNDVAVTPTYDNGTYVLRVSVPQDKWPKQPEITEATSPQGEGLPDDGQGGEPVTDQEGDWPEVDPWQDGEEYEDGQW